jgi:hypothetical protein
VFPDLNEIYPYRQFDKDIDNPLWVQMGETSKDLFGKPNSISPRKLSRAASKLVPEGNPFVAMVGGFVKQLMEADKTGETYATINEYLVNNPTVKRVFNATPGIPVWARDEQRDLTIRDNSISEEQTRTVREIVQVKGADPLAVKKAASEYIKKQPMVDRERLYDLKDAEMWLNKNKIENRTYYRSKMDLKPATRADIFFEDVTNRKRTTEEQARKYLRQSKLIPGFWSSPFQDRWYELVRHSGKKLPPK